MLVSRLINTFSCNLIKHIRMKQNNLIKYTRMKQNTENYTDGYFTDKHRQ